MIKLDSIKISNNHTYSQLKDVRNTSMKSLAKADSMTPSTDPNDKSKNNKKLAYILGGIVLASGTVFAIIKLRNRSILKKGKLDKITEEALEKNQKFNERSREQDKIIQRLDEESRKLNEKIQKMKEWSQKSEKQW